MKKCRRHRGLNYDSPHQGVTEKLKLTLIRLTCYVDPTTSREVKMRVIIPNDATISQPIDNVSPKQVRMTHIEEEGGRKENNRSTDKSF